MTDPIETVLQDLGKMRGAAFLELLRLPAPLPLRKALEEVDGLLSRLETDVRRIKAATPAPSPEALEEARNRLIVEITKTSTTLLNREIVAQADRILSGLGFDSPEVTRAIPRSGGR